MPRETIKLRFAYHTGGFVGPLGIEVCAGRLEGFGLIPEGYMGDIEITKSNAPFKGSFKIIAKTWGKIDIPKFKEPRLLIYVSFEDWAFGYPLQKGKVMYISIKPIQKQGL